MEIEPRDRYFKKLRTGGEVGMTIYCPKCGNLYELFYNAGIPVWGCQKCRDKQILVWSDRAISTDEQREKVKWE